MKILPIFLSLIVLVSLFGDHASGGSTSEQIDALLEKNYAAQNVKPNAPALDATLVRRLYLDIVGRIPTRDEAEAFIASTAPDKTPKLIDELINSEGYTNHWFNFWADLLRLNAKSNNNQLVAPHYAEFIKAALRENRPYDQFVRELLTTDGAAWDSGAIGYYLRDRGMPLDNMSNTVRVFLGTRLECAQCHDHPFDKWTQLDYYKMAAFSYDMDANYRPKLGEELRAYGKKAGKKGGNLQQVKGMKEAYTEMMRPLRYTAIQREEKDLHLPDDYKYDNAKPNQVVAAKTMFGPDAPDNLDAYAEWMTSKENPRFATVIANRLWKEVFGIGLIEPVDDINDYTKASIPELMTFLEEQMKTQNYDLQAFLKMLYSTKAYQREASREEIIPGQLFHFPGPVLRRMSAEQIWDSFVTLINPEPDACPERLIEASEEQLTMVHKIHESLKALNKDELMEGMKAVAATASEGARETRELTAQIAEARKAKDEAKVLELSRETKGFRNDVRKDIREHIYEPGWQKLVASGKAAEVFGAEEAAEPFATRGDGMKMMNAKKSGKRGGAVLDARGKRDYMAKGMSLGIKDREELREFVEFMTKMSSQAQRAANLPSPAPNGHFLREFGQSDRDVIENANDEASLPQTLQLLNGPYGEALVGKYGVLGREVLQEQTTEGRVNAIYLSLYSRYPTPAERDYLEPMVTKFGDDAYKDLVYAILNTQQFLFIQ